MSNNNFAILPISLNNEIIHLYKNIFTEYINLDNESIIDKANGSSRDKAQWFAIYNDENHIVGFCTIAVINPFSAFIFNFGIVQQYRRKGYANKLLKYMIDNFGSIDLYLFVKYDNRAAITLYRKYEFEYCDECYKPPKGELCFRRKKTKFDQC